MPRRPGSAESSGRNLPRLCSQNRVLGWYLSGGSCSVEARVVIPWLSPSSRRPRLGRFLEGKASVRDERLSTITESEGNDRTSPRKAFQELSETLCSASPKCVQLFSLYGAGNFVAASRRRCTC